MGSTELHPFKKINVPVETINISMFLIFFFIHDFLIVNGNVKPFKIYTYSGNYQIPKYLILRTYLMTESTIDRHF